MKAPVLHLVAGPNGAGKTTFYDHILAPATGLPLINADHLAARHWPQAPSAHAYQAAEMAERQRREAIENRRSFAAETVFSHPSKLDLLKRARNAGYRSYLYVILIPEELAVQRVLVRVETGGHPVPEEKIRTRFRRLWSLLRQALPLADEAQILDNSRASTPFLPVARYLAGQPIAEPDWPLWTPAELRGD